MEHAREHGMIGLDDERTAPARVVKTETTIPGYS
jgi:hypothetical protein